MMAGAGGLVFVAMLASLTPTPLYAVYQQRWGMSSTWVSVAFTAYTVGVLALLLTMGGLSDRWGRRPTLVLGAAVMSAAMLVLAFASGPAWVVAGRVLSGLGTGLVS